MPLKVYNTLSRDYEIFEPLSPPNVNMYVCGITPYDETHLGHGRAYVVFDAILRYLGYSGYKVKYIQNLTDIDDKIIKRANELGIPINELTKKYIDSFHEVMDKLNVKRASNYPKATEHIKDMIVVIEELVKKGYAYVVEGDVYFEVGKFKDYGKLSKRKLDDLKEGARVAVDERKKAPLDFALWKSAKEGEPSWDSPWGKGRPGWHIECSTMSKKYLGETFDIHGGGLDLIFPHHENEIAQAECSTGKPFAKYWIHNGFVTVNQEKMSKSLGNFFTLRDIFAKYDPMLVRFYLLSTHYRSPVNFSDADLENAKGGLERLINALSIVREKASCSKEQVSDKDLKAIKDGFVRSMDNDFNTAEALGSAFKLCDRIFELNKENNASPKIWAQVTSLFKDIVIDVLGLNIQLKKLPEDIQALASAIRAARAKKDYKRSDEIRAELLKKGYFVEITKTNEINVRKGV
ncbi:MAG: cysteine--tRNA ligase [bacterium]